MLPNGVPEAADREHDHADAPRPHELRRHRRATSGRAGRSVLVEDGHGDQNGGASRALTRVYVRRGGLRVTPAEVQWMQGGTAFAAPLP